ncbi:hypothetical protein PNBC_02660 [Paenibacillus crassostreae]|uniref:Uncharacterized protein n=1 Tax=Paenibacillus crassostreae TaxID=1763538 RepID=A0A167F9U0_9BACL|nr:hypothetical protein PNBC_02660 [Paenibacillus crassostreae]
MPLKVSCGPSLEGRNGQDVYIWGYFGLEYICVPLIGEFSPGVTQNIEFLQRNNASDHVTQQSVENFLYTNL